MDAKEYAKLRNEKAVEIAKRIANKLNQIALDELIDEEVHMQGAVWQNLASWLIAGAIKISKKVNLSADETGLMLQDLLNAGFEMEKKMREPMEITNEKPEASEVN